MNLRIGKLRLGLIVIVLGAISLAVIILGLVIAPSSPTTSSTPGQRRASQLEIHLLAVEHGDAQLIISPTGETLLIDAGRAEFAQKTANYLRNVLGDVTVDYFMATHYDIDHIGGVAPLMRDHGLIVRQAIFDRGGNRDELAESAYHGYYDYITVVWRKFDRT